MPSEDRYDARKHSRSARLRASCCRTVNLARQSGSDSAGALRMAATACALDRARGSRRCGRSWGRSGRFGPWAPCRGLAGRHRAHDAGPQCSSASTSAVPQSRRRRVGVPMTGTQSSCQQRPRAIKHGSERVKSRRFAISTAVRSLLVTARDKQLCVSLSLSAAVAPAGDVSGALSLSIARPDSFADGLRAFRAAETLWRSWTKLRAGHDARLRPCDRERGVPTRPPRCWTLRGRTNAGRRRMTASAPSQRRSSSSASSRRICPKFVWLHRLPLTAQHYRIIRNKTSEGISPWYLLLGSTSAASSLLNILVLQWHVLRCCSHWGFGGCLENVLGILQIGLQWLSFNSACATTRRR